MKKIMLFVFFVTSSAWSQQYNSFTDPRDGQTYKTVKIGNQIWMAQNLNYETDSGSWCYEKNWLNCNKFGRLYDWETAKNAAPPGWHLPDKSEFETLIRHLSAGGMSPNKQIIEGGSSGFNALYGGSSDYLGNFFHMSYTAFYWSATEHNIFQAWRCEIDYTADKPIMAAAQTNCGFSVRCVKDTVIKNDGNIKVKSKYNKSEGKNKSQGLFIDVRDGKTYKTVKIGNQVWMAENLNYKAKGGYHCYNDSSFYCEKFGRMYDWETAKKAAPPGWHLPSKEELDTLMKNINGSREGAYKSIIPGGSSGFNALLVGSYQPLLYFEGFGEFSYFWSSSIYDYEWPWSLMVESFSKTARVVSTSPFLDVSVRCIKDKETKLTGTIKDCQIHETLKDKMQNFNTFTDSRDGKTYKTIEIGGQVWMAENLNFKTKKGSYCYNDSSTYCGKLGRLYDWETAKKAVPPGWHLPSKAEFDTLMKNLLRDAGNSYKGIIQGGSSGFNALLGGWTHKFFDYNGIGESGYFWSDENFNDALSWCLQIESYTNTAGLIHTDPGLAFSVRCIKDTETKKAEMDKNQPKKDIKLTYGKFTDSRDGKTYKTIKIGNQIWMAENFKYDTKDGCYCYDNKTSNGDTYGKLYNWESAQRAVPKGWHLPSRKEFKNLIQYLGGEENVYATLITADDFDFFCRLGGRWAAADSSYSYIDYNASFWTSTEYDMDNACVMEATSFNKRVHLRFYYPKKDALSVLLIKN